MRVKRALRRHRKNINRIKIKDTVIGGGAPLVLFAGPCVVEDIDACITIAKHVKKACVRRGISYVFKASYDKANKTIPGSYRGPGWKKGLKVLQRVRSEVSVPIISDVHEREQCLPVAKVCDVLQIPALLSKQIDLIIEAAKTGRPINIKKGQFTAPWEMKNILTNLKRKGYKDILITERGTVFGYQQLISDMRALVILSRLGHPVIFDASHSVSGSDGLARSIGKKNRDFIAPLCSAAAACGIDGLFLEVHQCPDKALSDSQGTFLLSDIETLLDQVLEIDNILAR